MSEITLQKSLEERFEAKLKEILDETGVKYEIVYLTSNVAVHPTYDLPIPYMVPWYPCRTGVYPADKFSLSLYKREEHPIVQGILKQITKAVRTIGKDTPVVIYFAPEDEKKEKYASSIYVNVLDIDDKEECGLAVCYSSSFLVAPVGSRIQQYPPENAEDAV